MGSTVLNTGRPAMATKLFRSRIRRAVLAADMGDSLGLFRAEIHDALTGGILPAGLIDLGDFTSTDSLLHPDEKYHVNAVVQHSTLYLVQIPRHVGFREHAKQQQQQKADQDQPPRICAISGFCAGLLPAAAISLAIAPVPHTTVNLLFHAHELFRVALWIGIRSESLLAETPLDASRKSSDHGHEGDHGTASVSGTPCAFAVNKLSPGDAVELID